MRVIVVLQACQGDIDAVVRISELWGLALSTKKVRPT